MGSGNYQPKNEFICTTAIGKKDEARSDDKETVDVIHPIRPAVVACLGGLLFGYDLGVVSGALPQLSIEFKLTPEQQEGVVSALFWGAGIGACFGGPLCDLVGRRVGLWVTDAVFVTGSLLLVTSSSLSQLWIGRIIVGCGVSLSGIADVSYLHEVAPTASLRGSWVSCHEAAISGGILMAYALGGLLEWRALFGVAGFLAALQALGMCFLVESPVWLEAVGRFEEAKIVRKRLGHHDEDSVISSHTDGSSLDSTISLTPIRCDESDQLIRCYKSDGSYESLPIITAMNDTSGGGERIDLFASGQLKRYYKQILLAVFLAVGQQTCGQVVVLNYAPELFREVGINNVTISTVWMGLLKFITTLVVIFRINEMGKKGLLLIGQSMITISLLCLFYRAHVGPVGAVVSAIGVVMGYSLSYGPLTWVLTAEMFPPLLRGKAIGASTLITNIAAAAVSGTYLSLDHPFAWYGFISFSSVLFTALTIPRNSVEGEMEESLKQMWIWQLLDGLLGCNYATDTDEWASIIAKKSLLKQKVLV